MTTSSHPPEYKQVTFQQLRSFCESVRLGSFSAAAASLGISHPTVLSQVHALERHLGAELVQTHARGCRPTAEGSRLAAMAAPLVSGIGSLERNFRETRAEEAIRLVLGATSRTLVHDLPGCVVEFTRRWPNVNLTLVEMKVEEVPEAVESGRVDLGLAHTNIADPGTDWIEFEPAYELDVVLVTPRDHPLARRRRLTGRDLTGYPLVNAPPGMLDPRIVISLEMLGAFRTGPRRVEASFAAAVRRYVELGFGIGLIARLPFEEPAPRLHERSMSHEFGRVKMHLVWRKGVLHSPPARGFADLVKGLDGRKAPGRGRRRADLRARPS
jgi:DNA-binding transcriptional LysR family regulator